MICRCRTYPFEFFKGSLPQILLGPFLNTLLQMISGDHFSLFAIAVEFTNYRFEFDTSIYYFIGKKKRKFRKSGKTFHRLNISSSSRPEVFCKKRVLKNFTKFTGKHLYLTCDSVDSFFNNKVAGLRLAQVFSCEFCENFKNNFFCRTPLVAASVFQQTKTLNSRISSDSLKLLNWKIYKSAVKKKKILSSYCSSDKLCFSLVIIQEISYKRKHIMCHV